MFEVVSSLGTALGLGVGAGVNAYATFLVFGLLARFFPRFVQGDLASFFATTPVLIVIGVLYVVEFVADKVPAVDHVWDAIHTFIRPIAGGVVAVASMAPDMPKSVVVLAAIIGGGSALTGHVTKASVRAASTTTTLGTANPVISVIEDIYVFAQTVIAILAPLLFLGLFVLVFTPIVIFVVRRARRAHVAEQ